MTRHWRWLFAAALLVGAAVPFVLGGDQVLVRLRSVPLGWLALLVAMIAVCWNLNAWRLRVMLNGRAPGLGHGAALATVMATEFTLNATPGGSGAPFTLAALLRRPRRSWRWISSPTCWCSRPCCRRWPCTGWPVIWTWLPGGRWRCRSR